MDIIETERLILSHFTPADTAFIIELLNTESWKQFIGDRNIKTEEDARNYLLNGPMKSYAQNNFGLYKVILKEGNTPIGMCGLIKRDTLDDVDIGFAFLPDYEGKGYAFEASVATLEYGQKELDIHRIVAITNTDNTKSIKLLERLGLKFERMIKFNNEDKELMLFANQKEHR